MQSMVEGASDLMRGPLLTLKKAKRLRREMSAPEARVWSRLRERASDRPAFRRQHPVGPHVLDFYCAKARLAIEIDGIAHDLGSQPHRDIKRDAWLEERGITVVRIAVRDLMKIDDVVDGISRLAAELAARLHHRPSGGPSPPQAGEDEV